MSGRPLLVGAPRLRSMLRYAYGVATGGFGLIDRDYQTLHWTPVHELLWRSGNGQVRDVLTRRIISVQWHHHDARDTRGRTWSSQETESGWREYQESVRADLERYFLPHVKSELDVIELGSGIGAGALAIAPLARTYIGVDVSKPSIRASEHVCRSMTNATFLCNDGLSLSSMPSDSADLIHCGGTFMHMDIAHMHGYLRDFYRILRDKGRICISYPNFENDRWFGSFKVSVSKQRSVPYSSLASYRVRYLTSRMVSRMLDDIGYKDLHFFNKSEPDEIGDMSEADHCWATKP